ncbi:LuxR C-terminal-related transcriptional regulator [Streptomyces sp. NBC_01571]|uniref:LuxR C-terminal-related transcriptional regulator n=1 Tax=Streptomyces sp. NBC_01571 TaxID=2975883 RepID=UPI00225B7F3D|nr:LuxR C-terminal-related transcriptional regulator [Streptomyces sp. NBC_01571]MCX4579411.1 LuxR C-terminal-related transcriptional regulator [Streptomyces sp. NBC_01571]
MGPDRNPGRPPRRSAVRGRDIAEVLALSVRTVDSHRLRAYAELGVTTRRELARTLRAVPPGASPQHARRPS